MHPGDSAPCWNCGRPVVKQASGCPFCGADQRLRTLPDVERRVRQKPEDSDADDAADQDASPTPDDD